MISGWTILRNGVRFDYPFRESIASALPLVDEFVVSLGQSDDGTQEVLESLAPTQPKLRISHQPWPIDQPELMRGGQILSRQTNLGLAELHPQATWALYLQADEVLHEEDYDSIRMAMKVADERPDIDGLCFDYVHLYGAFDVEQYSRSAYRREVRLIKTSAGLRSHGDAQSFRKSDGSKPRVLHSGARVFHYGWVRQPDAMKAKTFHMDQLYHGAPTASNAAQEQPHTGDNYRYRRQWGLRRLGQQHPAVMRERIQTQGWSWDLEGSKPDYRISDAKRVVLDLVERFSGKRFFEYRCYRLLDDPRLRR